MSFKVVHLDDEIQVLDEFEKMLALGLLGQTVHLQSMDSPDDFQTALTRLDLVDVIILDNHLGPDHQSVGIDLAKTCRRRFPNAAIFMCSNAQDLSSIKESLMHGADEYIVKGQSRAQIKLCLERILKEKILSTASNTSHHCVGTTMRSIENRIPSILSSAVNCVYVEGESGTGKEVVATIFEKTLPNDTPFLKVNCGSIPYALVASELFGYVKGAFTGALTDKKGLLESANNGWLFLDEVSTLPPDAQTSLLRAIENQSIRPIGSNREIPINCRIISASNEPLGVLVASGRFRKDLWQRLREIQINLPSLQERRDEIPELIYFFCQTMRGGPYTLAPAVLKVLTTYRWSDGNIRELRNCLRAMTARSLDKVLTLNAIPKCIWERINMRSIDSAHQIAPMASNDDNTLTISWTGALRPCFQTLVSKMLYELLIDEFNTSGPLQMRQVAKKLGIPKSSLSSKLSNMIDDQVATQSDVMALFRSRISV